MTFVFVFLLEVYHFSSAHLGNAWQKLGRKIRICCIHHPISSFSLLFYRLQLGFSRNWWTPTSETGCDPSPPAAQLCGLSWKHPSLTASLVIPFGKEFSFTEMCLLVFLGTPDTITVQFLAVSRQTVYVGNVNILSP